MVVHVPQAARTRSNYNPAHHSSASNVQKCPERQRAAFMISFALLLAPSRCLHATWLLSLWERELTYSRLNWSWPSEGTESAAVRDGVITLLPWARHITKALCLLCCRGNWDKALKSGHRVFIFTVKWPHTRLRNNEPSLSLAWILVEVNHRSIKGPWCKTKNKCLKPQ